jgi:hypothetical protein
MLQCVEMGKPLTRMGPGAFLRSEYAHTQLQTHGEVPVRTQVKEHNRNLHATYSGQVGVIRAHIYQTVALHEGARGCENAVLDRLPHGRSTAC